MPEIVFLAVLMALGMSAYWAMVLFPRQREFTKRQQMARELSEGDEIITYGGIIGKVKHINAQEGIAIVEIADAVQVRMVIASMVQRYDPEEIAKNAKIGLDNVSVRDDVTV